VLKTFAMYGAAALFASILGPCSEAMAAAPPGYPETLTLTITGSASNDGNYEFIWDDGDGSWQWAGFDAGSNGALRTNGTGQVTIDYDEEPMDWDGSDFGSIDWSTPGGSGAFAGGSITVVPEGGLTASAAGFFTMFAMRRSKPQRRRSSRLYK